MKKFILFLLLFFLCPFFVYWWTCHVQDNNCNCFAQKTNLSSSITKPPNHATPNNQPFTIKDGSNTIVTVPAKEQFKFATSKDQAQLSPKLKNGFRTLAQYLRQHPNKRIDIMGQYASTENNTTKYPNLGKARAEEVKQQLRRFGIDPRKIETSAQEHAQLTFANDTLWGGIAIDFQEKIDVTAPLPKNITAFTIKDGKETIVTVPAEAQFKFPKSKEQADIHPNMQKGFKNLASYLRKNPDKRLGITGHYATTELNDTKFNNLGIARAETIKKQLQSLGVASNRIVTTASVHPQLTFSKDTLWGGIDVTIKNKPVLAVRDGDIVILEAEEGIAFEDSKADLILTPKLKKGLGQISDHLKNSPDRELEVIGKYGKTEQNSTDFDNLGEARADAVKKELMKSGSPSDKIATTGQLDSKLEAKEGKQPNAVDFKFKVTQELEKELLNLSRKLYFEFGKSTLNITPELEKYFKDVKTYLQQDTKKKVELTGHTDGVGFVGDNLDLGKKRAEDVKQELVKIGIPKDRIVTKTRGEYEPIATNDTEEGRQQNRRVAVIMK